jgi:chemotaxis protein CheC
MQQQVGLTRDEMAIWTWLVSKGITKSLTGLSQMVGQELIVNSLEMQEYPIAETPNLLGGAENIVVGTYLSISGDADGHLVLVHQPQIAFDLIDMQMGQAPGTTKTMEEMERSVIGEIGNITASFFLGAIADATGLLLMPSPPAVMVDMAGAILGVAISNLMLQQDTALVAKSTFGTASREIDGTFIILPTSEFMMTIINKLRTTNSGE